MRKLKDVFWGLCSKLSGVLGVGIDKPAHFMVCFAYSMLLSSFFGVIVGVLSSISLGIGKEYGDSKAINNKWDWFDILADVLGALVGGLIGFFVNKLIILIF